MKHQLHMHMNIAAGVPPTVQDKLKFPFSFINPSIVATLRGGLISGVDL